MDDIKSSGDNKKSKNKKSQDKPMPGIDSLIARMKVSLGDSIKDVRISSRLTDSAVCLVADEGDLDMHMERMLKQHQQLDSANLSRRILELNANHSMIKALAKLAEKAKEGNPVIDSAGRLLLDQARILEGEPPKDPIAFTHQMNELLLKTL